VTELISAAELMPRFKRDLEGGRCLEPVVQGMVLFVRRFLRGSLGVRDEHLVEEVVQDTLMRVHRAVTRGRYDEAKGSAGYLAAIARNSYLKLREDRGRLRLEVDASEEPMEPMDPDIADICEIVAEDEEAEEVRRSVLKRAGGLSPRESSVLVMRYFEDLSVRETAEILGSSESAIKNLASSGRTKLWDLFTKYRGFISFFALFFFRPPHS
jgi:RNA polymerase sigma factor (sigma-70 family)